MSQKNGYKVISTHGKSETLWDYFLILIDNNNQLIKVVDLTHNGNKPTYFFRL